MWSQIFNHPFPINYGISGDCIQDVMRRVMYGLSRKVGIVIIHVGTNNITKNEPNEIAQAILKLVRNSLPAATIVITGLLHRGLKPSKFCFLIDAVNDNLTAIVQNRKNIILILSDSSWIRKKNILNTDLYFTDNLQTDIS